MADNTLNAAIAVDFSLIGTKLHTMYKKDDKGYKILLIPSVQSDNQGVSIGELIEDIKKLTKSVTKDENVDTAELTSALEGAAKESGNTGAGINDIRIILNMAYLYISKEDGADKKGEVEYAFNLNILTTGLIPQALADIVSVDHIGIAVWNTNRTQILNQMSIAKIEDYLALPA